MSNEKKRLDIVLVEKNLYETRQISQTNIMCGNVLVNGKKILKPGEKIFDTSVIEILNRSKNIYVSRGGLKLKKAIDEFGINLSEKICFDIGASTGGFTDCMLREGAKKVFAIDVGYGQLDYKIRIDDRVEVFERTNVRYIDENKFDSKGDFASIDVSFISLTKILNKVKTFLKNDAEIVALIKPQFEAGKTKVNKKGIVKDKEVHFEVVNYISMFVRSNNFGVLNITYSPIKGGDGNIEFLIYLVNDKEKDNKIVNDTYIWDIVNLAHQK